MKHLKIAFLGIVSMLLMAFIVFIPMNAKAAKVTNGDSVKLEKPGKQFYRFTLGEDSLVQLNWSKNAKKKAVIRIYDDKNKMTLVHAVSNMGSNGKDFIALDAGTYYVDMFDNTATPTTVVKFSWTSASKYSRENYSAKTAKKLNPDTLVTIVCTNNYNYDRWYKITLTEAQKVTIKAPYGGVAYLYIYNKDFEWLNDNYDSNDNTIFSSVDVLPKGMYYIFCDVSKTNFYSGLGNYITFKWQ